MSVLGYVVICWNQASRRPEVQSADLLDTLTEAQILRDTAYAHQAETGDRRDQFTVATVQESYA